MIHKSLKDDDKDDDDEDDDVDVDDEGTLVSVNIPSQYDSDSDSDTVGDDEDEKKLKEKQIKHLYIVVMTLHHVKSHYDKKDLIMMTCYDTERGFKKWYKRMIKEKGTDVNNVLSIYKIKSPSNEPSLSTTALDTFTRGGGFGS